MIHCSIRNKKLTKKLQQCSVSTEQPEVHLTSSFTYLFNATKARIHQGFTTNKQKNTTL